MRSKRDADQKHRHPFSDDPPTVPDDERREPCQHSTGLVVISGYVCEIRQWFGPSLRVVIPCARHTDRNLAN